MKYQLTGLLLASLLAQACEPPAVQHPPGSAQYPAAPNPQQVQIDKDRRWAHAVETAQKASLIGGLFGGPFGAPASMGLGAIGFIYGMFTADSRIAEEKALAQTRYQKESDKDRQLETAIEQEIERQRALENQIAGVLGQPATAEPASLPPQISETTPAPAKSVPQSNNPATGTTIVARASAPTSPVQQQPVTVENKTQPMIVARASAPPQPAPTPFRNVEVRDINGDGVPDIWIYYNPQKPGEIIRQEEATKGDGRVDAWGYFKDGQLVRRDVDRKGDGRPDTIYYYDNDKIAREERDETGQGRMTYRATYQNGRLAKVEKDSNGQGSPDLWTYYDVSRDGEIVVKEERDLTGDGIADLWSYYENGRLVRRDVNAPGLEILSKQDQIPAPVAELRPPVIPGS